MCVDLWSTKWTWSPSLKHWQRRSTAGGPGASSSWFPPSFSEGAWFQEKSLTSKHLCRKVLMCHNQSLQRASAAFDHVQWVLQHPCNSIDMACVLLNDRRCLWPNAPQNSSQHTSTSRFQRDALGRRSSLASPRWAVFSVIGSDSLGIYLHQAHTAHIFKMPAFSVEHASSLVDDKKGPKLAPQMQVALCSFATFVSRTWWVRTVSGRRKVEEEERLRQTQRHTTILQFLAFSEYVIFHSAVFSRFG